jgi:hypothetical protein
MRVTSTEYQILFTNYFVLNKKNEQYRSNSRSPECGKIDFIQ